MKMKQRMLIFILGPVLVLFSGIIIFNGVNTNQMGVDTSTDLATVSAERVALLVQDEIEAPLDAARTLSHIF